MDQVTNLESNLSKVLLPHNSPLQLFHRKEDLESHIDNLKVFFFIKCSVGTFSDPITQPTTMYYCSELAIELLISNIFFSDQVCLLFNNYLSSWAYYFFAVLLVQENQYLWSEKGVFDRSSMFDFLPPYYCFLRLLVVGLHLRLLRIVIPIKAAAGKKKACRWWWGMRLTSQGTSSLWGRLSFFSGCPLNHLFKLQGRLCSPERYYFTLSM